ncbi:hypothetical protein D1872_229720 [compost metagenome]
MPLLVDDHPGGIYPGVSHKFTDKPAVLIIRDFADKPGFQAELGASDRDIGGRTADIFGEGQRFFHGPVIFHRIQINAGASDGNHIVIFGCYGLLHVVRPLCYSNEGLGYRAVTTFFRV